jgi:hypothetical protein
VTNAVLSVLGVAAFLVFVGVLIWEVPRLDLGTIVVIAALFVILDRLILRSKTG